jgi:hypothetical protein
MEEQKTIIVIDKESLLFLASAIIVAGMASNYSTICPSETHALIAQGLAKHLMEKIYK